MNELTLRKHIVDKCVANLVSYFCFLLQVEPTKVEESFQDESWVKAMHDELLQFQKNDVWTLVPRSEPSTLYQSTFEPLLQYLIGLVL